MKTFQLRPDPALCPFVDRLWGWEAESNEVVQLPTLLPGTGAELYFHYGAPFRYVQPGRRQASADLGHLFCVRDKPIQLSSSSNLGFIAVRFKIGAIHRFTRVPGEGFHDQIPAVGDMWGASGNELLRHLQYANDMDERIALIQSFLKRQLRCASLDAAIEKSISILYRQSASISIETLAGQLGLGRRQFERRFKAFCGQSPNGVKCLCRFQRTIRKLMLDDAEAPTGVALDNGYYDQAHFIHDFQRRVGTTPQRYLAEARAKTHFYNTSLR